MMFKRPCVGDIKIRKSFCIIPQESTSFVYWLEKATLEYIYVEYHINHVLYKHWEKRCITRGWE